MRNILFILLWSCLSAWAGSELKVITLQHRFANDLLPIITPLVGENGTATGINNQLIIRADASHMQEIENLISQLDTARVNRKITIRSDQNTQSYESAVEAQANIQRGKIIINSTPQHSNNSIQINTENNQSNHKNATQQFVNVLDGERAFIYVGEMVPYTQDWIILTQQHFHTYSTTHWREISTGFSVRPRTIGNQVELEITPRIARRNSNEFIDFEELSTTVQIALGDWIDIGNLMQQKDDVSQKILSLRTSNYETRQALKVKVD
ncbi:MAG: secretin N-terminal domain-containing protein [Methylophilus sp.]|nr:secretin N-terminal domain-containing protein [Methylophilus sp.]